MVGMLRDGQGMNPKHSRHARSIALSGIVMAVMAQCATIATQDPTGRGSVDHFFVIDAGGESRRYSWIDAAGEHAGRGSAIWNIDSGKQREADISLKVRYCGEDRTFTVPRDVNPWVWGNWIEGMAFPFGIALDYMSGAIWRRTGAVIMGPESHCEDRSNADLARRLFTYEKAPSDGAGKLMGASVTGGAALVALFLGSYYCYGDGVARQRCERNRANMVLVSIPLLGSTAYLVAGAQADREDYLKWNRAYRHEGDRPLPVGQEMELGLRLPF